MKRALLYILVLVLIINNIKGVPGNEKFYSKTISDGLANNWINCFVQDRQGFIWIGTDDGLSRFDGYQFINFRHNPDDRNSIGDNSINALACDNQGNIWISCSGSGLFKYSPHYDTFEKKTFPDSKFGTLNISCLYKSSSGKIWIGTTTGELACFDPLNNSIIVDNLGIYEKNIKILKILEDKKMNLWIGSTDGLFRYFPRSAKHEKVPYSFATGYLQPLFKNHDNNICFYNLDNELYMFDEKKQKYVLLWKRPSDLPHIVSEIVPGVKNELWLGCDNGLMKLIKKPNKKYKLFYAGEESYFKLPVKSLYKDGMNNLWVGTWRKGIFYSQLKNNSAGFMHIVPEPTKPYSKANVVRCLISNGNKIIAGTDWGGVYRINSIKEKSNINHSAKKLTKIPLKLITGLANGPSGRLLVGTYGLYEYDNQLKKITNHYHETKENSEIVYIKHLDTNHLVFTSDSKIYFLDLKTKQITRTLDISRYCSGHIRTLIYETNNTLWIGQSDGLVRLNIDDLESKVYRHDQLKYNSLSNNTVHCLKMDKKERIWIGTKNGLNLYNPLNDNFIIFNEQNGLPNSFIHALEEDENGDLWISTNKGISKFSVADLSYKILIHEDLSNYFTNYDHSDGLQSNQFCKNSSCKTKDGYMAFGGINGITLFHPDSIKIKPHTLNVNLTGLKLFNKDVPISPGEENSILKKHIEKSNELVLSHRQNFITIDYVAFNYISPENIEYAYILDGFDPDWNYVEGQKSANYTNLSPGEYTFRVKASIKGRSWNSAEKTLKIKVLPPWWKTFWFRIFFILSLFGTIYLLYWLRIRSLKRSHKELEKEVSRRTIDLNNLNKKLQDQAQALQEKNRNLVTSQQKILEQNEEISMQKANLENQNKEMAKQNEEIIRITQKLHESDQLRFRFFTNISHEFRTPLTLIINPLDSILRNEKLNARLKEKISLVCKNASRLLTLINQLLEFRKIDNETSELNPDYLDIVDVIKTIYGSFALSADKKNIEYTFASEYESLIACFDPDKIEKIMFNLLSNAFKFTPENGKIWVELKNGYDGNYLVKISDTGKGINKEELDKIFNRFYNTTGQTTLDSGSGIGLSLTKLLVEMHGGKIDVASTPGEGSSFTITMPLKINNNSIPVNLPLIHPKYSSVEYGIEEYEKECVEEKIIPGAKLLIIEDNDDLRVFLNEELAEFYRIIIARNGKEGYDIALREIPDLIISDIMMPVMNGYELCKRIKMEWQTNHIPVILLTARTDEKSLVQGLEFGADGYMRKPFDMLHLKKQIHNLLVSRKMLFEKYSKDISVFPETGLTEGDSDFINKVYDIIEENLSNKLFNVETLAEELKVSRSLLYKKVLDINKLSIGELIRITRLKKAATLIRENKYNISEIAEMVGFSERPAFTRSFSKFYGFSPKQYQIKCLKKVLHPK